MPPLPSLDRVPPIAEYEDDLPQPDLQRTSQIPPAVTDTEGMQTVSNKAVLKLQGDLNQMAMGWSNEEWTNRRRLIQFWRQQEGNVINATFRPIPQPEFVPNSIVISCIFRDDWNECFVTSVDAIYLLEALVGVRFTVEEKNRIRRNLEGFKPMTVSKTKPDSEAFFKLIMGFPNPKPRNIEKDVKVFPWKTLAGALKKIIGKYVSHARKCLVNRMSLTLVPFTSLRRTLRLSVMCLVWTILVVATKTVPALHRLVLTDNVVAAVEQLAEHHLVWPTVTRNPNLHRHPPSCLHPTRMWHHNLCHRHLTLYSLLSSVVHIGSKPTTPPRGQATKGIAVSDLLRARMALLNRPKDVRGSTTRQVQHPTMKCIRTRKLQLRVPWDLPPRLFRIRGPGPKVRVAQPRPARIR